MGIQSLTGFIENNDFLTEQCELKETLVVVDGRALQRFVFEQSSNRAANALYAGNYVQFGKELGEFLDMLDVARITPIVVFDGGKHPDNPCAANDPSVLASTAGGRVAECHKKPILSSLVLAQLLTARNVQKVRAKFECFADIVSIANKLECPVLSINSDFYLADVKAGFIHMNTLMTSDGKPLVFGRRKSQSDEENEPREEVLHDIRDQIEKMNVDDEDSNHIKCRKFFLDSFLPEFKGLQRDVLPLFAVIMGNAKRMRHYRDDAIFDAIYKLGRIDTEHKFTLKVTMIATGLRLIQFPSKNFTHKKLYKLLMFLAGKSLDEAIYKFEEKINWPHRNSSARERFMEAVWVTEQYYDGHYATNCLIDHLNLPQSNTCELDHSYYWANGEKQLSDKVIRQVIEDNLSPTTITMYFHGVLTLTMQPDDCNQESAFNCTVDLLKCFVSLLRSDDKESAETAPSVQPDYNHCFLLPTPAGRVVKMPTYPELESMTYTDKKQLLLSIICVHNEQLEALFSAAKLIVNGSRDAEEMMAYLIALLRYTLTKVTHVEQKQLFQKFAIAVIVSSLFYLNDHAICADKNVLEDLAGRRTAIDHPIVHCYTQFQSVFHVFAQIDALLGFMAPKMEPAKMWNGVLIHNVVQNFEVLQVPSFLNDLFEDPTTFGGDVQGESGGRDTIVEQEQVDVAE